MLKKVSVEERLPPLYKFVTCIDSQGEHMVYRHTEYGWNMRDVPSANSPNNNYKITHWIEDEIGMNELLTEIINFQNTTFPKSSAFSKASHLKKEVKELIYDLENNVEKSITNEEYADCFILLLGSAASYDLSISDIKREIQRKLEINKKRKWGTADENGVVLHVKE